MARNTIMLEREIEQKAIRLAGQQLGCIQLKMYEQFWPDRLVLMQGGRIIFVEFKRPGGRLSQGQKIQFERIREQGFEVFVVYSVEEYLRVLSTVRSR
jgi:hypothetical protein